MEDINFEWYKVFYNVAKYENITKAAENMYISQSAVTQSIQKLENELGGKIFYRTKQGVVLTEEGEKIYKYIKNSIETMSNASFLFSQYISIEKGSIRIGSDDSVLKSIFKESIINYIKKYPNIELKMESGKNEELLYKLSNGDLDIVLLNLPVSNKYPNIDIIETGNTKYCFYASKELINGREFKKIEDLQNYKLILPTENSTKRKIIDEILKENEINIKPQYEIENTYITKKMILKNIGVGFDTKECIEDIKEDIDVIDIERDYQLGIAILKKDMCNKATLKLYEMMVKNA